MADSIRVDKEFLAEELKKLKGVYVPVRSGFLERLLVRQARCRNLHPNPADEFCVPEVGPNDQIIGRYVTEFREERRHSRRYLYEPLIVEKIRPEGYMILNGHHRWAAAMRLGYPVIPVRIVNIPQEQDIVKIIERSTHDARVTLDLDEVVFCGEEEMSEKPLPFPSGRIYKERLRRGIPALFRFLSLKGYDIWVYTAGYYSLDYIRRFFRKYNAHVDGVVCGLKKKSADLSTSGQNMKQLFANKYPFTMHIDGDMVLQIDSRTGQFKERGLDGFSPEWSQKVMEAVEELCRDEGGKD